MEKLLQEILSELKEMKVNQQTTNQRLENVEAEQRSASQMLGNLETGLRTTDEKLDHLSNQLYILAQDQKNDVVTLLQQMDHEIRDVSSRVNQLTQIQDRQHRVIELLSARSVEHEAELKRRQ